MSEKFKRGCRWMLMLLICTVGVRNLTGCVVDRDHGGHHDDWHDDHR